MNQETQPDLLPVLPDDGLLLPDDRVRHVFTAEQMERRRALVAAIRLCLVAGYGCDYIAQTIGVSSHTVRVLRNRGLESVAGSAKELGRYLVGHGARWVGIAAGKEEQAGFRDLMIGAGIAIQRGAELLAMGEAERLGEAKGVVVEEDQVAARVRALLEAPLIEAPSDSESAGNGQESQQIEGASGTGAKSGASGAAGGPGVEAGAAGPGGGVRDPAGAVDEDAKQ